MNNIKYLAVFIMTFFSFGCEIFALKDIKVDNESLSPLFEKNIYTYNYYTYSDNVVISTINEKNEEVSGYGSFNVMPGENVFIVTSTIDGIRKEYKLNIFRDYEKNTDSTSAILKDLNIKGYDIDFNSAIYNYEIVIGEEDSLEIDYETMSEASNVKIIGNNNLLKSSNIIEVVVTSGDKNNTSVYTINVKKTKVVFNEIKEVNTIKEFTDLDRGISITIIVSVICSSIVLNSFSNIYLL